MAVNFSQMWHSGAIFRISLGCLTQLLADAFISLHHAITPEVESSKYLPMPDLSCVSAELHLRKQTDYSIHIITTS
jgi:hypothetical protein